MHNFKKTIALALCIFCMLTSVAVLAEEEQPIVLPAGEAAHTEGKGVSPICRNGKTEYDAENGLIVCLPDKGEVTFTLPDGVHGTFDMYLNVSKYVIQFSSQPFTFRINGGETFSAPVDCMAPANDIESYPEGSEAYNVGSAYDQGRFLIRSKVELKAGDTVTVIATYGSKGTKLRTKAYPAVGNLELYPAGSLVGVGYDHRILRSDETDANDPLSGKTILWLGSSVTYGMYSAGHYTMADAIQDGHKGTICEKYAISGTTLANQSPDSYVARLKLIPTDKHVDLVVVQLSTNDASRNMPFGDITESFDSSSFDETTITGAMETIIAWVKEYLDCPVVFYTGTYFENENYGNMVDLLMRIQEKWHIGVVDLYNNEDMNAIYGTEQYYEYMANDGIHPYRKGYVEWWTPVFEETLSELLKP